MYDLIRGPKRKAIRCRSGHPAGQPLTRNRPTPLIPFIPREVWACGCTYETSAAFRDAEHGTREGILCARLSRPRPEIFFKGTARICVGPGQADRHPRRFEVHRAGAGTGGDARAQGARCSATRSANDVSAWDIERENPLYLPQSKMYTACCALGPVIVTADEIADPYNLHDDLHDRARVGDACFRASTSHGASAPQDREADRVSAAMRIRYLPGPCCSPEPASS